MGHFHCVKNISKHLRRKLKPHFSTLILMGRNCKFYDKLAQMRNLKQRSFPTKLVGRNPLFGIDRRHALTQPTSSIVAISLGVAKSHKNFCLTLG